MRLVAPNKIVSALALALLTAPFVAVERARAACSPPTSEAAPISNTTVTCTGATTDQNADNVNTFAGYGTGNETAVTVNVGDATTSASVRSSSNVAGSDGIFIHDGTVNNFAGSTVTVAGTNGAGIQAFGNITVNNSGNINFDGVRGHGDRGILTDGTANVINTGTGTIFGNIAGIDASGAVNVTNSGSIGSNVGAAIKAATAATVSNSVDGSIFTSGTNAIGILAGGVATVDNSGAITALGGGGIGINATNATVTNSGTISATGPGGTAVNASDTATLNTNNGSITGDQQGIQASTIVVNANDGTIEATGGDSIAILANSNATVTNGSGTIRANIAGSGGIAIVAGGTATINSNAGSISGDLFGIRANSVTVNSNTGTIEAKGASGIAINALAGDVTVTSNTGSIQANVAGTGGIAIKANGAATVDSNGGAISGDAFGIFANTVTVNANTGTIEAKRTLGTAISAVGTATVANGVGGRITGDEFGISADAVNVTANAGTISGGTIAITANRTATVANRAGGQITGGAFGIQAAALDVTNAFGSTISGAGNAGIEGSGTVRNAGTISGAKSVSFNGGAGATNQLILQTGSVLNGDAVGGNGATNNLILQGNGIASNNFTSFNNLDVQANGLWVLSGTTNVDATIVNSGTLVVDGALGSPAVTVNSGGTLAGHGTLLGRSNVSVMSGGAVAPGAAVPFSTLNVNANVNFAGGSVFRVNANAAMQNDVLLASTVTLAGGTVQVLASGTFAPSSSTKYTILTAPVGVTGTFSSVTTTSAFLTPTLSYDATDVFLTLATITGGTGGTGGGFGFASAAQTRNQIAVAGALDASPQSNPLVTALLTQTADGARQAFDALSGEVFGSVQKVQAGQMQFARSAMLGRLRQASYSGAPGELGALAFGGPELAQLAYAADGNGFPVKAPGMGDRSRDLTFWAQGLGGWGHTDSDGNAASVRSRFGGFLSGVDARYGDTLRAGLVAGYMRSDLNAAARSSSAGIDSVQLGAYAGGRLGAFNVRGGASYSYDSIDTSRSIAFPGFGDQTQAHFHGQVGQVFGEVGYGMTFNQVAVEPLAGLAYVHLHNGAFLESGGVAALSGSSVNENIGYSSLGARAATALPLANGTVLVPRGSLQWKHAFGDVTPAAALAFQGTGAAFSVAGVPIARDTALVEGGFDWRFSPQAKLGAYYQGELAAHAQAHAFKGTFNWNF